jgi:site-specific DNA-methyltransferase (adenine-specific)
MKSRRCLRCRARLPGQTTGRQRHYCSDACRQAACRKRRARPRHFRSDSDEWATPPALFARLDALYGPFSVDVAATAENALCPAYFTSDDDGLAQRWRGRVWCNPPYGGDAGRWVRKARESVEAGDALIVVCLIPARTDTRWWHRDVQGVAEVEFLERRVRFLRPGGVEVPGGGAPFPSAVVVFRDALPRVFRDANNVTKWPAGIIDCCAGFPSRPGGGRDSPDPPDSPWRRPGG